MNSDAPQPARPGNFLSRHRRGVKVVSITCVLLLIGYGGLIQMNERSGMHCVELWAGVSPVPAGATEVRLTPGGNMFTRSFLLEFDASNEVVRRWLESSPGTADLATDEVLRQVMRERAANFRLEPGEGAQWAEVTLIRGVNGRIRVLVQTCWS
jgi:hypothetical protein